ncbi:ammonium transporter [Leptolyngbyaceae cyanobacterium JSC-12]|nr:ammonium transporter [Leptolyngbyaceae cyanobacterium JSC-12]
MERVQQSTVINKSTIINNSAKHQKFYKQIVLPFAVGAVLSMSTAGLAAEPDAAIAPADWKVVADTLWVILTGMLVFFMNAGFCMLETGFCRRKNAVNLLAKNLIVFALSTLAYWAVGFAIMFGDGTLYWGMSGFFLTGQDNSPAVGTAYSGVFDSLSWASIPLEVKFFFQLAFAGTAATIVSGAIAERVKFVAFFIFSLFLVAFAYPVTGHWIWGGGWLQKLGFWDFAGSTVVHSVGGWAGLVGAILLGPRLGRYKSGMGIAMPGHNLAIATLGCFILWLGWFGFNPGSTLAANPQQIGHIILTTNFAATAGAVGATLASWFYLGKPDLSMIINGLLAGLVGITAACPYVAFPSAVIIGLIAGGIIVFAVTYIDTHQIDDPVGALSVHLIGGIWGTLAVGLFSVGPNVYSWYGQDGGPSGGLFTTGNVQQLLIQVLGIGAVGLYTVLFSWVVWWLLKMTMGIRVTPTGEQIGLDITEHGMEAYSGFSDDEFGV